MWRLCVDKATYMRLYAVSALANIPDKRIIADRLLINQEEIGGAIVPYYGRKAGYELTGLLKVDILTAIEVLTAVNSGDLKNLV